MPARHSNYCRHSSPNFSQNSFTAMRIKLLPRRAGVLAFLPFESTRATLSFLTKMPTQCTICPPTSISHSKCLDKGMLPYSMPRRLNRLCVLLCTPDDSNKRCSRCSLKYDSLIRVTIEPLSRRLLVGLPFSDITISGHGATAWFMMSSLLSLLSCLHESSLHNKSRSCTV